MRRASRTLLFWVMSISKNSDTLEIAEHSLFNSSIIIHRCGFHFRSSDLGSKPLSLEKDSSVIEPF